MKRPISLIVRQCSIFITSLLLDDFPLKQRTEYVIWGYYHSCWIGCDSCSQKGTNMSLSLSMWRHVPVMRYVEIHGTALPSGHTKIDSF